MILIHLIISTVFITYHILTIITIHQCQWNFMRKIHKATSATLIMVCIHMNNKFTCFSVIKLMIYIVSDQGHGILEFI